MNVRLKPPTILGLSIIALAVILQLSAMGYLSTLSRNQLVDTTNHMKIQITKDIAAQLSRAMATQDDLGALAAIKACRSNHPQLRAAMVFDSNGRISLHTDPGMMGKTTPAPKGPRLVTPILKQQSLDGRNMTVVLAPLPDDDDYYVRIFFDDIKAIQNSRAYHVRYYILIASTSLFLGAFIIMHLKRYDVVNPKERSTSTSTALNHSKNKQIQTITKELTQSQTDQIIVIDHTNTILGLSTSVCDSTKNNADQYLNKHIMKTGLPKILIQHYQNAIQHPDKRYQADSFSISCYPASSTWQIAIIRQS